MHDPEYREFVQTIIDNVKTNGFPDKKVAFPIEQLYEAAEKKSINLNKVLDTLDEIQIAHVKTPEKIIFYARDRWPLRSPAPSGDESASGIADMVGNIDPEILRGMDPSQMMAAAAQMMQNMTPEQLDSAKKMYDSMTPEQRAELMEQARKMGF